MSLQVSDLHVYANARGLDGYDGQFFCLPDGMGLCFTGETFQTRQVVHSHRVAIACYPVGHSHLLLKTCLPFLAVGSLADAVASVLRDTYHFMLFGDLCPFVDDASQGGIDPTNEGHRAVSLE